MTTYLFRGKMGLRSNLFSHLGYTSLVRLVGSTAFYCQSNKVFHLRANFQNFLAKLLFFRCIDPYRKARFPTNSILSDRDLSIKKHR